MKISLQDIGSPKRNRRSRLAVPLLIFLVLILGITSLIITLPGPKEIERWTADHGLILRIFYENPAQYFRSIAHHVISGRFSTPDLPILALDVKFKNWQKIVDKRNIALRDGKLQATDDDYVKAQIRIGDQTVKIKMRLKGDWSDHFDSDKWSFRIKVQGKESILGMRVFSLQHPKTRGFHGEPLFFSMLRDFGVLTPRYFFVREVLNGKDMGVMALEEHFSKELLEHNSRRESVILKFDESLYWDYIDDPTLSFNDYTGARIDSFQSSKVRASNKLSADFKTAAGLLRGFINRKLHPSEVFDVEQMGALLAIADIWGSYHVLRWHNLRFYFNPISARLEPIAFDANLQELEDIPTSGDAPIIHHIMEDPFIRLSYARTLRLVKEKFRGQGYLEELSRRAEEFSRQLGGDYPLIPPPLFSDPAGRIARIEQLLQGASSNQIFVEECDGDLVRGWAVDTEHPDTKVMVDIHSASDQSYSVRADGHAMSLHGPGLQALGLADDQHGFSLAQPGIGNELKEWCTALTGRRATPRNGISIQTRDKGHHYKTVAHVDRIFLAGRDVLEFNNITEDFLEVRALEQLTPNKDGVDTPIPLEIDGLPLVLPPKRPEIAYSPIILPLPGAIAGSAKLQASVAVAGESHVIRTSVGSLPPALSFRPLGGVRIEEQLRRHSFLRLDPGSTYLDVVPGKWMINDFLDIPSGYILRIKKGTELLFGENCALITHGPLLFNGTAEEPIILGPLEPEKTWLGVAMLGNGDLPRSQWSHVTVRGTSGVSLPAWSLTAGVTFYRASLTLTHCRFEDNRAEDGLNLVHSEFTLEEPFFYNTLSDGLDCDFSRGVIKGGKFHIIGSAGGGDAIDVSGSEVDVVGSVITEVSDKGISVGEASKLTAKEVKISRVGTGLASKDGSRALMNDSVIKHGLVAGILVYNKKSEYAAAEVNADNVRIEECGLPAAAQFGNILKLNGKTVVAGKIDVQELYRTVMKPGMK
ncbi:MAG: CotH kinase family protein [Desulfobulbaceae bacterium]|nr:CotH kinase family protein [Desulfobulbaceae bacterium]